MADPLFAHFHRSKCCHSMHRFTALIMKQSLRGRHGIPLPGIYLPANHTGPVYETKKGEVYRQRTFLRSDPRLGVPQSQIYFQITVSREHACPDTQVEEDEISTNFCNLNSLTAAVCGCANRTTKARRAAGAAFCVILARRSAPLRKSESLLSE